MSPVLSIIIPCYNSQNTVEETLKSVLNQKYEDWEAIIVNDGSPDNLEEVVLKWIEKDSRFQYYKKENEGLGKARNYGIKKALGEIILPLDSDNKIRPNFVKANIHKFKDDPELGVLYGNAQYFGDKKGLWNVGEFNKYKLLNHNYIDACALIRTKTLQTVNYFEENLPYQGHEDWDLWLKILNSNYHFLHVDEIAFDYRVSGDSMIKSFNEEMLNTNIDFINEKHFRQYIKAMSELYRENIKLKYVIENSRKIKFINRLRNIKRKLG